MVDKLTATGVSVSRDSAAELAARGMPVSCEALAPATRRFASEPAGAKVDLYQRLETHDGNSTDGSGPASRALVSAGSRTFKPLELRMASRSEAKAGAGMPTPRPDLGQYTFNVMAPLLIGDWRHPDSPASQAAFAQFGAMLREAKAHGAETVSTDVWWGIVEPKDNEFNWDYYDRIAGEIEKAGLCWMPILSFHQCGGAYSGDGDNQVSLPNFVGEKYKNLAPADGTEAPFFMSEQNHYDDESISPWASQATANEYRDLMAAFQQHFVNRAGKISEINISLGPAGELRYPSYDGQGHEDNGCPTRGTFQAYSELAQESFRKFALAKYGGLEGLNRAWGIHLDAATEIRPPTNANEFFARSDDKNTQYGRDLFDWYNGSLLEHGKLLLSTAVNVFDGPGAAFKGIDIGAKVAGVHWRIASDRDAEENAGLIRTSEAATDWNSDSAGHGYADVVKMLHDVREMPNAPQIVMHFTCLEKDDGEAGDSRAKSLVRWVAGAAHKFGLIIKGENALPYIGQRGWQNIEEAIRDDGYRGLTVLRLPLSPEDEEELARLSRKYP